MIRTRARGKTRLTTYHYLIYKDVLQEVERARGVLSRAQALWQHSYDRYQAHRCPHSARTLQSTTLHNLLTRLISLTPFGV